MVEKLIVDNFAGIEHLEIEVKKINIMIGLKPVVRVSVQNYYFILKSLSLS